MPALANLAWSGEFRKASPANSHGRIMPGDRLIRLNSVVHAHVFSDRLVFDGAFRSSAICYHHVTTLGRSMVKLDREYQDNQDMSTRNGNFCLCVFVMLKNWLGEFKVLSCRVRIQSLTLISCTW
jgi:hypothetical protein